MDDLDGYAMKSASQSFSHPTIREPILDSTMFLNRD